MEEKRITVRYANRIVRITENELKKYISKGYEIVEDKAEAVQTIAPQVPIDATEAITPRKQRRRK